MTTQKELIPMLPGDLLRYRREQSGLTLERASELSKMKPGVLAAIESGETADIPSVYLRGYIRNYARFLGIDAAEVEERLAQVQGAEPVVQSVFTVDQGRGRGEKWLKASSYLAASALIAALAWQFTHEAVRFSQGESQLTAASAVPRDAGSQVSSEAAAERRPASTHLNASIASVEVLQQRGELSGKTAAGQAWEAIGEQGEPVAPAAGNHHLEISTSADSWVEITDGEGAQLEMDLIRAGNSRVYTGSWPFQVMLGRASSVVLTMDGEPVDLGPHSRGNVARLTLGGETAADSGQTQNPESR
jgi:cytoskeleton protein RodZ